MSIRIQVIVECPEAEVDGVIDKIERCLCPDPDHAGPCPIPWTITTSAVDEPEASDWRQSFAVERPG